MSFEEKLLSGLRRPYCGRCRSALFASSLFILFRYSAIKSARLSIRSTSQKISSEFGERFDVRTKGSTRFERSNSPTGLGLRSRSKSSKGPDEETARDCSSGAEGRELEKLGRTWAEYLKSKRGDRNE